MESVECLDLENKKGVETNCHPFFIRGEMSRRGNYSKPYCFSFLRKVPRFKPKTCAARV